MTTAIKLPAEVQRIEGEIVEADVQNVTAVTRSASFSSLRGLVESSPPPRRPNRSAPIHDAEFMAWEAASDEAWDMIE